MSSRISSEDINIRWLFETNCGFEVTSVEKFRTLKPKVLAHFDRILDRFEDLKLFIKNYLFVNEDSLQSEFMCSYLNDLDGIFLRLEQEIDALEKTHSYIKIIRKNAAEINSLMTLANSLMETERFAKAIEIYGKVLAQNPQYDFRVQALCDQAKAYKKTGNFREAVNNYINVLILAPDRTDVRLQRAECYNYLEEWGKCVEDYEFVMETDVVKNDSVMAAKVRSNIRYSKARMQRNMAEQKNIDGNYQFKLKKYSMAEKLYTEAIELWPDNVLFYESRCKCLIFLGYYKRALEDAKYIVKVNKNSVMGYRNVIKCYLILGDYDAASRAIDELNKIVSKERVCEEYTNLHSKLIFYEETALQCYREKRYQSVEWFSEEALKILPESINFKIMKAESFMYLGQTEQIERMRNDLGFSDADRLYLKSLCLYYNGNLEETLKLLGGALQLDPNHNHSLIMQEKVGRLVVKDGEIYSSNAYQDIAHACTEALDVPKMSTQLITKLLYNRAVAQSKIGNICEAVSDCDNALKNDKNNVNILLLRAECHEYIEQFEKSITDYRAALNIESVKHNVVKSVQITSKIENLKTEIKKQVAKQHEFAGDNCYEQKNFGLAGTNYDKAIDCWSENISFYKKRIACYMIIADYKQAIQKCQSALIVDNNSMEIHEYLAECYLMTGDIHSATRSIQRCIETGSERNKLDKHKKQLGELERFTTKATESSRIGDYERAIIELDMALKIAIASFDLKVLKAECLALLGRIEEANILASHCIQVNPSSADAVYIRALCIYPTDLDRGLKCLKKAIVLDPDHSKSKTLALKLKNFQERKKSGIKMFEEEKYREASKNLSEALQIVPIKNQGIIPKLLYKLAFANSKIGRIRDAINDCTKAIKNNWSPLSFFKLRASCFMSMRNFDKAMNDYKFLLEKEESSEVQTLLEHAQNKLKRQQSSDYYDILDIDKNASLANIKTAYKQLALIHHPDKHSNATPNEIAEQQEIFKKVSVAYEVLSNPHKRADYDEKHKKNNNKKNDK